tara:strand:+ start:504 stop:887 length:384 start_codon:yes stop_codon:yes gene_type:complete
MIKKIFLIFVILLCCCNQKDKKIKKIDPKLINNHNFNLKNGKKVFNKSCITCHLYGTAGSITLYDSLSWSKIINNKPREEIYSNVINGYMGEKGPMPQKGGCLDCSNNDLLDAIEYILSINNLSINN